MGLRSICQREGDPKTNIPACRLELSFVAIYSRLSAPHVNMNFLVTLMPPTASPTSASVDSSMAVLLRATLGIGLRESHQNPLVFGSQITRHTMPKYLSLKLPASLPFWK
jgi:hypothetical protein